MSYFLGSMGEDIKYYGREKQNFENKTITHINKETTQ
jgi:hypothetical protein